MVGQFAKAIPSNAGQGPQHDHGVESKRILQGDSRLREGRRERTNSGISLYESFAASTNKFGVPVRILIALIPTANSHHLAGQKTKQRIFFGFATIPECPLAIFFIKIKKTFCFLFRCRNAPPPASP